MQWRFDQQRDSSSLNTYTNYSLITSWQLARPSLHPNYSLILVIKLNVAMRRRHGWPGASSSQTIRGQSKIDKVVVVEITCPFLVWLFLFFWDNFDRNYIPFLVLEINLTLVRTQIGQNVKQKLIIFPKLNCTYPLN